MKLLNRATKQYILISLPVLLLGLTVFYFVIHKINVYHVDENLKEEAEHFEEQLNLKKSLNIEEDFSEDHFTLHRIQEGEHFEESFKTIKIYDKEEDEVELYREFVSEIEIYGDRFELVLRDSLLEDSTIIYGSVAFFSCFLLFLLVFAVVLNRKSSQTLWLPFYDTLEKIENYRSNSETETVFPNESISEFNQLNVSLNKMTKKIYQDFHLQRNLFDMISHEIQTPLSVIRSHIEILFQSKNLTEEEFNQLSQINRTVNKLSRLNRSILILSRIENGFYKELEDVDIYQRIKLLLEEFELPIEEKNLRVEVNRSLVFKKIHPVLVDILIRNLLQNAVRHNVENGYIKIEFTHRKLSVKNSGKHLKDSPENMFKKFTKSSDSESSIGLGLSLIKAICELNEFSINYKYTHETLEHNLEVGW